MRRTLGKKLADTESALDWLNFTYPGSTDPHVAKYRNKYTRRIETLRKQAAARSTRRTA